ncbi:MAG: 50S ribosomal protein L32 [Candidatus Moranbacteria bacterium]|nr:50S ribosomal protein L32 [Candidatus Moranbacteria bacterium]
MPVPKQRHNTARKGRRRAGQKSTKTLSASNAVKCPKCSELTVPHRACSSCGTYKGKQVVSTKK